MIILYVETIPCTGNMGKKFISSIFILFSLWHILDTDLRDDGEMNVRKEKAIEKRTTLMYVGETTKQN